MMRPWWELWPGRLEAELRSLDDAGINWERDERAFRSGVLKLRIRLRVDGEALDLEAIYPDLYPYVRFQVSAPTLTLGRHQHPFAKQLCLIGRSTWNWRTTDTLAEDLVRRLPLVLTSARTPDPILAAALEEAQGEPFTDYYEYPIPGAMVLVDSDWDLDTSIKTGRLELALEMGCLNYEGDKVPVVRGAVAQVQSFDGKQT